MSRKLVLGLIILSCILCISAVSANDNSTLVNESTDLLSVDNNIEVISVDDETPDVPDLVVNETVYVESNNIDDFFVDGALQSKYANKTLIFSGKFENFGKLAINVDNVTLIGTGSSLKNVVFDITGDNVTLNDFNMDLDSNFQDNDGAAIQVSSNNVNLINLNINYVVPTNVEAYGVYGVSNSENPIRKLKILNSTINFEGHNDEALTYNCAIKLINSHDSVIENNTITASLPLRDVNFGVHGATLDSDYVMAVGMEGCRNFTLSGNTVICDVNNRPATQYPTMDCILISQSDDSLIYNNSIYMTDFETKPGLENFIYGIDIYSLNNLTIAKNNISIVTTGGKLAAGTAYPIQVTGPIDLVNITDNDLYSFSNGPNIGIYSQNYYGATALSITNNRINVTGLAGVHEWALVAGIESQDSNSTILNNTIEVHSVGEVNIDDNIYGVSYRQHTAGNHTYNIQNNTVFSDGFYSVSLLGSVNSTIANNLLVSYNEKANNSNSGYNYGDLKNHEGDEFYNNQVLRYNDYFASLYNEIDGGDEYNYETPTNINGITNNVDGGSVSARDTTKSYSYNPLIPGSSKTRGNNQNSPDDNKGHENPDSTGGNTGDGESGESGNGGVIGGDSDGEDGDNGIGIDIGGGNGNSSNSNALSLRDLLTSFINSNSDDGQVNTTSYNDGNSNVPSNSSDVTPAVGNMESASSQAKSTASDSSQPSANPSSAGDSSVSKAYELEDLTKEPLFIPSVIFVLIALGLLVVGYRRKKN